MFFDWLAFWSIMGGLVLMVKGAEIILRALFDEDC